MDKKPSAYAAFASRGRIEHVGAPIGSIGSTTVEPEKEKGKGGRPSKEELRLRKLAAASASIAALIADKPSRKKILAHMERRIAELDAEKRGL
jgi:hypothetical protein